MQPKAYDYLSHLKIHLGNLDKIFNERPVWPRQIFFYLPGDHVRPCNFHCSFCAGQLGVKDLPHWESEGLKLLNNLGDVIPYHMYSGFFTEPLLNSFLLTYMKTTKRNGCCYGLKTNGSLLLRREGFIESVIEIADKPKDYISVSLDAGYAKSHARIKRVPEYVFEEVCDGARALVEQRGNKEYPAIRFSYLLNHVNDSPAEVRHAIVLAKGIGVDSIRFSQPHPAYGLKKKTADRQWRRIYRRDAKYREMLEPLVSDDADERPFVFFAGPARPGNFGQCAYGYYQIAISHDGGVYRCTCTADTRFSSMRLGKVTSDLESFRQYIKANQDPTFDPQECFSQGVYCCRAGVAVNEAWQARQ